MENEKTFGDDHSGEQYKPSTEEIQSFAQNIVFKGFEEVQRKDGQSYEQMYTDITTGLLKAVELIKSETGYDLSNLQFSFFKLPARSPWTIFDIYITDVDGNEMKFNESYECNDTTPDGKGLDAPNDVNPDRLAELIYNDLINEKEFLRINGT